MGRDQTSGAARLAAICGACLAVAAIPVGLAAGAAGPGAEAEALRTANGSLDAREATATLELYALESRLAAARAEVASIAAQRDTLRRERAATQRQHRLATQALRVAQEQLAALVRTLYEQSGRTDPISGVLGAASLEEALTGLDGLQRAAGENDRIVEQTRAARNRLNALGARLATREAELERLASAASAQAASLEAAAAARRTYITGLQRRQGLNRARIQALETRVAEARTRSVALSPAPAAVGSPPTETRTPAFSARPGATLTVRATGYAIHGRTATGMRTAPGVVAVDPSVIPLGTRMTIPGYGTGIAADTGGAVHGNVIDLWFPTRQAALAWGTRTVTITIR